MFLGFVKFFGEGTADQRATAPRLEPLEERKFFSASPAYDAHAIVRGESMAQWAAAWWQKVFAIPVYAADGKTIINPQFDDPINPGDSVKTVHALPSDDGKALFLFGSFFGGDISRTVTVPTWFQPLLIWASPGADAMGNRCTNQSGAS